MKLIRLPRNLAAFSVIVTAGTIVRPYREMFTHRLAIAAMVMLGLLGAVMLTTNGASTVPTIPTHTITLTADTTEMPPVPLPHDNCPTVVHADGLVTCVGPAPYSCSMDTNTCWRDNNKIYCNNNSTCWVCDYNLNCGRPIDGDAEVADGGDPDYDPEPVGNSDPIQLQ